MKNQIMFAGHRFSDVLPNPEGDILIAATHKWPYALSVRAGVKGECCYTPDTHPYAVIVRVIEGEGLFFLKEELWGYLPGSVFEVGAYVPHSFIEVWCDTVFIKDVPDMTPE